MKLRTFLKALALLIVSLTLLVPAPQATAATCTGVQLDVVSKTKLRRNNFAYTLLARVPSPNQGVTSKINGLVTPVVDLGNGSYHVNTVTQPGAIWFFEVKTSTGLILSCTMALP